MHRRRLLAQGIRHLQAADDASRRQDNVALSMNELLHLTSLAHLVSRK